MLAEMPAQQIGISFAFVNTVATCFQRFDHKKARMGEEGIAPQSVQVLITSFWEKTTQNGKAGLIHQRK